MLKTEIHRKDGTRITVEGSESEVRKILSILQRNEVDKQQMPHKRRVRKTPKMSIADMLLELKEERFFDHPRSLVEIKNALVEKGSFYPVTTLSAQVIRQVRNRNLARIKQENKWMYLRSKENVKAKRPK